MANVYWKRLLQLIMVLKIKAKGQEQEDQQSLEHAWTSRHKAGCVASQGAGPGPCGGVKHSTDAGEGSGRDGLVLGVALRQELNIVCGENNGDKETELGEIEGIVVENVIAEQGEVGLEPTQVHYEDGEGPTEAEAPQDHRPVNCALTPSVHAGHQQGGQPGGEQLPQVEEEARGPGAQA